MTEEQIVQFLDKNANFLKDNNFEDLVSQIYLDFVLGKDSIFSHSEDVAEIFYFLWYKLNIKFLNYLKVVPIFSFQLINPPSLTLPDNIIRIADHSFDWCSKLKDIYIPSSVKQIGFNQTNVFIDCPDITIHAPKDSFAAKYAERNDIKYIET